jgi:hypothetical protein
MASKWLRAFLEADDTPIPPPTDRANSADSANRPVFARPAPPIGAIGPIGTAETEPDRADGDAELLALSALSAQDEEPERAAPRTWAEGFTAIRTMSPPTGFSPERWRRIVDAAGRFLDRWADAAIAAGWSDLDVFGADPDRPDARFDCMGLVLLLDRVEVVGIDKDGADLLFETGARQRFRRRPLPHGTIPLWELGGPP